MPRESARSTSTPSRAGGSAGTSTRISAPEKRFEFSLELRVARKPLLGGGGPKAPKSPAAPPPYRTSAADNPGNWWSWSFQGQDVLEQFPPATPTPSSTEPKKKQGTARAWGQLAHKASASQGIPLYAGTATTQRRKEADKPDERLRQPPWSVEGFGYRGNARPAKTRAGLGATHEDWMAPGLMPRHTEGLRDAGFYLLQPGRPNNPAVAGYWCPTARARQ